MKKTSTVILAIVFIASMFTLIISSCFGNMIIFWCAFSIIIIICIYLIIRQLKITYFKCKTCGAVITPTKKQIVFAINSGNVKLFYCPHCEKKRWFSAITNEKDE